MGRHRPGDRTEEKLERETTWVRSENKYFSELFGIARNLVQGVAEKEKPDDRALP